MNQESQPPTINEAKVFLIAGIPTVVIALVAALIYISAFGAPQKRTELSGFSVPRDADQSSIAKKLKQEGFIKSPAGFKIASAFKSGEIESGQYRISKSMAAWEIAKILHDEPALRWVTIHEGLRKEQIVDLLAEELGWSDEDKKKWVTTYTAMKLDYLEGVYFPDSYLIPFDEEPMAVAERLQRHFEEQFAPYSKEALEQNIKWTTLLTVASLVQREAAGKDDMPLVAGILWNRLEKGMLLEVDATVQYARDSLAHYGEEPGDYQSGNYRIEGGWWAPVKPADMQIQSRYNTYQNKGLPPHPIANPGTDAISAVLTPTETACIYYLHDGSKIIHCAKTFEEHQANIENYLR